MPLSGVYGEGGLLRRGSQPWGGTTNLFPIIEDMREEDWDVGGTGTILNPPQVVTPHEVTFVAPASVEDDDGAPD